MSDLAWPVVCANCGERYAACRVYVRWGRDLKSFPSCAVCGPCPPLWLEDVGRADDIYHTLLRPVPAGYDPITSPYPSATKPERTSGLAMDNKYEL
jgi:hypothetical protein